MKKSDIKKQMITKELANYILENGLQSASLRNLARAANTSDRMLLHYFKDKDELLSEVLTFLSDELISIIESSRTERMPFNELVPFLSKTVKDPLIRPYLQLWLGFIGIASKKEEPYYSIARKICDGLYAFFKRAIYAEQEEDIEQLAAFALAAVEGMVLLDALGKDAEIEKALQGVRLLSK
ncbi:TetR family transcriptional regulator [Bacillus mangrovi]|uniref:TetR family transcriptional regulator n=1 Tax=Metabacillus mangrovi TaxID=1491830 RepID=A0A7X2S562_9BACI|nr:TetR/AcrR family transcriptional regulator [Metabacillus mangrovi]MTH53735.1 TetR family transcriptional regulator [Metabacillus mangrovi]